MGDNVIAERVAGKNEYGIQCYKWKDTDRWSEKDLIKAKCTLKTEFTSDRRFSAADRQYINDTE